MRHPLLQRRGGLQRSGVPWRLVVVVPALWLGLAATLDWPAGDATPFTGQLAPRLLATVTAALVLPSFALASWYVVASNRLDENRSARVLFNHAAAAAVSTWAWLALARLGADLWGRLVEAPVAPRALLDGSTPLLVTVGLATYAISVLGYALLLALEERQREALRLEEAGRLAKDAELRALKFQLNPHFLFNALNSISALTSSSPARAREMCVRLGDFLRRTLALGDRRVVPLGEELELVEQYLDLEAVRFEGRLRVELDVDETCRAVPVPPLILQPLVENAVKHGLGSLLGPMDLVLRVRRDGERVFVDVENTYDESAPARPGGRVGLDNTAARLERHYGGRESMTITRDGGRFAVRLALPVPPPGAEP